MGGLTSAKPVKSGISLVLPAFNEADCIRQAVNEAVEAFERMGVPFEIVVVNDGSKDSTVEIVRDLSSRDQRVRLVDLACNQGYGSALREGFLASRMPLVSFTDADCQFHLADLAILIEGARHAPVVVGWRQNRQDPWRRKFLSRGFNLLANTLVGTGVRDVDCALKVFHRDELLQIMPASGGFLVNTEMIVRARALGMAVKEHAVRHRSRAGGASKVRLTEVPRVFVGLIRFWFTQVAFNKQRQAASAGGGVVMEALGLVVLLALACALFLGNLRAPLLEPTEARYAEIPRQMLLQGNWLVPTLHGEPYLDKPPLFYWLVMAAYQVGGVSDRMARVVPGIAGVLTVLVAWGWLRVRAGPRAGWLAAFLLLTSVRFLHYERMLAMDSVLCLLVVGGIACLDLACSRGSLRRGWWLAAMLMVGLALLTKGFVAMPLVLGPACLWWWLDSRVARPGVREWGLGFGLLLFPLMAWMIPLTLRLDGFLEHFVWRHHVVRFLEPFDHAGPWWYYLPGLLFGLGPWMVLVPGLVRRVLGRSAQKAGGGQPVLGLILIALVFNLAFFSLAGCKRPIYSIAFMPFAALALGLHLDLVLPAGKWVLWRFPSIQARYALVITALAWCGLGWGAGYKGWLEPFSATLCVAMGGGLVLMLGLCSWGGRGISWAGGMASCAALAMVGSWEMLPRYHEGFSLRGHLRQSLRNRVSPELMSSMDPSSVELVCYPHRWDSASFYLPKARMHVFGPGERDELEQFLRQRPSALLLMKPGRNLDELLARFPTLSASIENPYGAVAVTRLEQRALTQSGLASGINE